ncbi:MAG: glycosyl hydrolase, partial [Acidobacteriota bacterium]|nr:glycosyl hydrolase [Acidobacteriota bacterium]
AVLGHLYGPNEERGVYRSKDGGTTWERILFVNPDAGAVDLAMDPTNPRILYASFWRVRRTPWSLESGGEGSGLWKSTDGGDSWQELTANEGLPVGPVGIIGITVSPTNPENLYAIVEADEGGVFRSRDGGETWTRTNQQRDLRQRAWYYTRIYADPGDEEAVYVVNVRFHRSQDGGRTFSQIPTPHGDNHDLWIAPEDPRRMVEANDGGANVSYDGGEHWSTQANQPTAQMYRVSVDNDFPYRLLGGQQDNSAVRIRSRSADRGFIGPRDWEPTAGGESGHIVAKPDDPDVVYGGSYGGFLMRVNHRTGERRLVNVWPDDPMGWGAAELKYRFQWNFPLFFSPHDADTLYAAANVLFRSRDGGETWEQLSADLTRDDKSKQGPSGGPITKDNTSVEYYATIFAALESPHEPGVLWAGSDDGLVHVSRNDGESWQEVTPPGLPEWTQINSIEAHPTEPGGLYLAGTRYKLDDFEPYLFRTLDYGATWQRIDAGIPRHHFTRVVRADPYRPGLLYAGTENGVYVSFDDGGSWQSLQLELPLAPVTDLAVKEQDLIAATQGRGYWILDDLTPLHQLAEARQAVDGGAPAHLFTPRPAYRLPGGQAEDPGPNGTNPPAGAVIHFYLPEVPELPSSEGTSSEATEASGEEEDLKAEDSSPAVRMQILEADGTVVRTFTPAPPKGQPGQGADERPDPGATELAELELEEGANHFVWDLRYPGAESFPGLVLWNRNLQGPRAVPGTYTARLEVGDWSAEAPFEVLADPRSSASPEDRQAQFDFLISVRDQLTRTHQAIGKVRTVREQLKGLEQRLEKSSVTAPKELTAAVDEVLEHLDTHEKALYQTKNQSPQDPLNYPIRLNDKLSNLLRLASFGDNAPTASMLEVRDELTAAIKEHLAALETIWNEELPQLNQLAREAEVPVILVPEEAAE